MATKYEELVRAESEPDDEPEPGEPEPEPGGEDDETAEEEEQPAEPEARAFDEVKFEKENARHERELRKLMGEAAPNMAPCPVCGGVGFTPEPEEAPVELRKHPDLKRCEVCEGAGLLATQSRRMGQTEVSCPKCGGNGYYAVGVSVTPAGTAEQAAYTPPPAPVLTPAPEADRQAIDELRRRGYIVSDTPLGGPTVAA